MDARRLVALLCFAALLAPAAVLAWMGRDVPHLGYFQDDALYWIGGKSLAEGHGYRILSLPEPYFQTKYPPLYSWLLAVVWKFDSSFPHNLRWALLVSWLMLPLYLWLARPLLRELTEAPLWAPLGLMALNPALIFLSLNLLPELLFSGLAFGSLLAAERAAGKSHGSLWAVGSGVLAGCAYLAKSAAVVVAPAVVIWLLVRRRPRQAGLFLAAALPAMLAWNYWVRTHMVHPVSRYYPH